MSHSHSTNSNPRSPEAPTDLPTVVTPTVSAPTGVRATRASRRDIRAEARAVAAAERAAAISEAAEEAAREAEKRQRQMDGFQATLIDYVTPEFIDAFDGEEPWGFVGGEAALTLTLMDATPGTQGGYSCVWQVSDPRFESESGEWSFYLYAEGAGRRVLGSVLEATILRHLGRVLEQLDDYRRQNAAIAARVSA